MDTDIQYHPQLIKHKEKRKLHLKFLLPMEENSENDVDVVSTSELKHGSVDDPKDRKRKLTSPPPILSTDESSPRLKTSKLVPRGPFESDVVDGGGSNTQKTAPMDERRSNVVADPDKIVHSNSSSRSNATFRYVVQNFSMLKGRQFSEPFIVRTLSWKILVCRRVIPNAEGSHTRFLAVFLQCDGVPECESWTCRATFEFRLLSQREDAENYCKEFHHTFHTTQDDWGINAFIEWDYVIDPENGFIKGDAIILEVKLVAEAPHGGCWNSRKYSGYVGLKNQGATCYMNSLLQTLFFASALRKAIYEIPSEAEFVVALQRVFYDLQFSDTPVNTKKLTRSFGWNATDSYVQHDVQEFLRKLLDHIEEQMKGTCVSGTVPKLFEGKVVSFIKCKNVDYHSSLSETFYDIQLNVKGKKNLYESFGDYVTKEILDGDNKYDAEQYGLQEAEKGVIFAVFPPVLHLHLMRFVYDTATESPIKFNDRFEFLEKINLSDYMQSSGATPAEFTLQAVLVHSGDNDRGHYVAFIDPKLEGNWCKFDDDTVSRCTKWEAIDSNFGGKEECPNAYMLVYIRDSEISSVLRDVTEEDIPREVLLRIRNSETQDLKMKE